MTTEWLQTALYICCGVAVVPGAAAILGTVMQISQAKQSVRDARAITAATTPRRTAQQTARSLKTPSIGLEHYPSPRSPADDRLCNAEAELQSTLRQAARTTAILGTVTLTIALALIR